MSRALIYAIVFIEGFCSLGAEVIALRRLVPHIGSSIVVTAPTIGFFLLALALGYASGAKVSGNYLAIVARNFLIAAVLGMPLGVLLGSNEKAYRSVEFLIDFFRSTPSSALIPLFLLIFGITDVNKIAISSFGAALIVLFNSAYGVMNAKKTRVMAAQSMGVSQGHVFKDVLLMESLAQTFVGLRSAVSMALVIVIVAEMFIGSETGLGHRIHKGFWISSFMISNSGLSCFGLAPATPLSIDMRAVREAPSKPMTAAILPSSRTTEAPTPIATMIVI